MPVRGGQSPILHLEADLRSVVAVADEQLMFFFSSRRRHTRCSRDWSSDVCSSDLLARSGRQEMIAALHAQGIKPILLGESDSKYGAVETRQEAARCAELFKKHREEIDRSEEHTSELQSRLHLVCRLLLEKKKTNHHM